MSSMLKVTEKHLVRCVTKEVVVVTFHVVEEDMEEVEGEEDIPEVVAEVPGVAEVHLAQDHEARTEEEVHRVHEVLADHPHQKPLQRVHETTLDQDHDLHATTQDLDPSHQDAPDLAPTTKRTNPG